MNTDLLIAAITNIVIGGLCIGLSVPLTKRRIKMNKWYGIRIPKSYASEENWVRINEYGGRTLIYWSIPVLLIGFLLIPVALTIEPTQSNDIGWIILVSISSLFILGALIQTLLWSRHLPEK